jgi:hypothetical protein
LFSDAEDTRSQAVLLPGNGTAEQLIDLHGQRTGLEGDGIGIHFVFGSHTRFFCASRKPWFVGWSFQISSFLIVVGSPEE